MCETACSAPSTSPWTKPETMFEVAEGEGPVDWLPRIKDRLLAAHPGHNLGDVTVRPDDGAVKRFDVALKHKVKRRFL